MREAWGKGGGLEKPSILWMVGSRAVHKPWLRLPNVTNKQGQWFPLAHHGFRTQSGNALGMATSQNVRNNPQQQVARIAKVFE